jgi:hypothetical protein
MMQMASTKNISGPCEHCGAPLEFPAENIGQTMLCPFCRKETLLVIGAPEVEVGVPRRALIWAVAGVLILILGLGAAMLALKQAQKRAGHRHTTAVEAPGR